MLQKQDNCIRATVIQSISALISCVHLLICPKLRITKLNKCQCPVTNPSPNPVNRAAFRETPWHLQKRPLKFNQLLPPREATPPPPYPRTNSSSDWECSGPGAHQPVFLQKQHPGGWKGPDSFSVPCETKSETSILSRSIKIGLAQRVLGPDNLNRDQVHL